MSSGTEHVIICGINAVESFGIVIINGKPSPAPQLMVASGTNEISKSFAGMVLATIEIVAVAPPSSSHKTAGSVTVISGATVVTSYIMYKAVLLVPIKSIISLSLT